MFRQPGRLVHKAASVSCPACTAPRSYRPRLYVEQSCKLTPRPNRLSECAVIELIERVLENAGGFNTRTSDVSKQVTRSRPGSVGRTISQALISRGSFRRRTPPFLPRTVS